MTDGHTCTTHALSCLYFPAAPLQRTLPAAPLPTLPTCPTGCGDARRQRRRLPRGGAGARPGGGGHARARRGVRPRHRARLQVPAGPCARGCVCVCVYVHNCPLRMAPGCGSSRQQHSCRSVALLMRTHASPRAGLFSPLGTARHSHALGPSALSNTRAVCAPLPVALPAPAPPTHARTRRW